jgi:hypothetical protein
LVIVGETKVPPVVVPVRAIFPVQVPETVRLLAVPPVAGNAPVTWLTGIAPEIVAAVPPVAGSVVGMVGNPSSEA